MAFGDLVQSNGGTGAASSSFSPTLGSAISAGNLVVLMVAANNVPSGTNAGWTKSTGLSPVANAQGLLWWFIGTAGQTIPSVTFAGASTYAWRIVEYAGPFDASPYNTSNGAATNGTMTSPATVTTTAITPTAAGNYLLVGGLGVQYGNASGNVAGITLGSFTNSFVNPTQQFRQAATEAHIACQVSQVVASASGSYSTAGNASVVGTSGADCRIGMTIAFKQGAAGGSVSMSATQGVLTASGQVNKLARSRDMDAVLSTLTLAGPTVNLIYSGAGPKTMPGGIGVATMSGQAAILRRTRIMPSAQATLTASGQTASLRLTHKTAGGQGILTLAGQANRLVYARKPAAGKGQLTLAGPVVNLIYSGSGAKVLPAGLGFPVLSGQTAVLRYIRKMPAAVSMATLGGQSAFLTYTQVTHRDILMPVSAGVLAMSGHPAFLDVTRAAPKTMKLQFGRKVYLRRW